MALLLRGDFVKYRYPFGVAELGILGDGFKGIDLVPEDPPTAPTGIDIQA